MWLVIACTSKPPPVVPITRVIRTQEDADELSRLVRALESQTEPPAPLHITLDGPATVLSDLGYVDGEGHPLDIELDGGGRLLSGYPLRIEGRRVDVHDLAFAGQHRSYALTVVAAEAVALSRIHIQEAPDDLSGKHQFRGGAIQITSIGPALQVDANEVTITESVGAYSVVMTGSGGGRFGDVRWRNGRFGACPAPEFGGSAASFSASGTVRMRPPSGESGPFVPERWLDGRDRDWTEIPYDEATLALWRAR